MDRWTDHQNFAAAGEQREEIASVHRAAIRSIQRVVSENATPHDEEYASAGIAELLKAGKVLVLTGAGVSTESGIPDYRGPGGSLHDHRPMTYQEFRYDDAARQRYWARSYVGWRRMRRAEPNRAHYALAELEQLGAVSGVITQNVDGLHARAGSCRLLALLLTLVLVIPAYGQETLDALAAAQGCTAETLLQSDKLTAGDSVSDWVAIAVSRAGTEGDTSAYRKALERYVTRMYREQGGLDRLRATEWQRTALTALALGADPTAFGRDKNGRSVNLLADGVYQFTAAKSLGTQGLNGWIFGLIALDSARFAVPEDAVYTRATILQALVAAQEPEGGFGLTVGNSDVDLTAMTLQALAPYQNSTVTYTGAAGESVTIREVVRRALAWLSDQQTAEGDFISWDAANLESTAQVIIALCSLGVDPATDARFVKNGISAVDGLMRYRLDDGTFRHILTDGSDVMATEQALLAQEAMERLSAARRSLYDFREEMPEDVKMQVTALNEALTDVAVATPEEVQALYTRYLAIPAAERSYVFAAGALLDRMQELSLEITPEDPAQAYELRVAAEETTSGPGAVVWIAAGVAVVVVAAGMVIWSKRRKICTK